MGEMKFIDRLFKESQIMATLTDLQNAIAAEKVAADTKFKALTDQIAALQGQLSNGVILTSADLDNLVAAVQAISTP
jgi:hypothetical protein